MSQKKLYSLDYYYKRKRELIKKLGGKCAICGSTKNLQFDHLDCRKKKYTIADNLTKGFDTIEKQFSKCQLLCRKCHLKKTLSDPQNKHLKLTSEQAQEIRMKHKDGVSSKQLAQQYGVAVRTINAICNNQRW